MNDEVVHTGFAPMAHYLFAVCCQKKVVDDNGTSTRLMRIGLDFDNTIIRYDEAFRQAAKERGLVADRISREQATGPGRNPSAARG